MLRRAQRNSSASWSRLTCHFRAPVPHIKGKKDDGLVCDGACFLSSPSPSPQLRSLAYVSLLGMERHLLWKQSVLTRYLFGACCPCWVADAMRRPETPLLLLLQLATLLAAAEEDEATDAAPLTFTRELMVARWESEKKLVPDAKVDDTLPFSFMKALNVRHLEINAQL